MFKLNRKAKKELVSQCQSFIESSDEFISTVEVMQSDVQKLIEINREWQELKIDEINMLTQLSNHLNVKLEGDKA